MINREKINQKEQEKIALKSFLNHMNLSKFSINDCCESPDFLLQDKDMVIGIEVVEYVDGKKKEIEKIRRKIEGELKKEIVNKFPSIYYDILIIWNVNNGKINFGGIKGINKLTSSIIEYVEKHLPENEIRHSSSNNKFHKLNLNDFFKRYINYISITRNDSIYTKTHVRFADSEYLDFDINIIKKIISNKRSKLFKYKKDLNETWLLIVAYEEWFYNSVNAEAVSKYKISECLSEDFDKIYFHQLNTKTVIDLKSNVNIL